MTTDSLKYFGWALLLLFIQAVVLNNIHLFGFATPLMLVYCVILLPVNMPRWVSLVMAFVLGLVSDMFTNTPGVCAASLTFVAFLQPVYLKLFLSRESPEDLQPSISSLGLAKYFSFSFPLTLLFVTMFFTLEEFSFFHWIQWLCLVGGSTAITYLILFVIELVRGK